MIVFPVEQQAEERVGLAMRKFIESQEAIKIAISMRIKDIMAKSFEAGYRAAYVEAQYQTRKESLRLIKEQD